ncbi:hypothetical protein [Micromonospora radicis]|uniref:Lipoprotein n=1 Tax=Micromonospora radicis TaxID=1894971 RepID=A0A418MP70_9ACTN|nr:hypothetical protein [Micromonospora radicis]RIV34338.1 hypothetical protein D2L64_23435 [Micromonospora radicis]
MVRLIRVMVIAAALSVSAACESAPAPAPTGSSTGAAPGTVTSPGALAAVPLRLPTVAAGEPCPVTEPRPWDDHDRAYRVLGPGPVYPVADYFPAGVLPLRERDRQRDGSFTVKVRWLGAGYTGPVLVRAGRIDGPGTASVEFSYLGERRDDGHHAVLTRPDTDLPASTTVGGPGCYAYQVDGVSFSFTVVFRAAPASS